MSHPDMTNDRFTSLIRQRRRELWEAQQKLEEAQRHLDRVERARAEQRANRPVIEHDPSGDPHA